MSQAARELTADRDAARLFLALWPDPSLQGQLAAHRDQWLWNAGPSVVPADRLHLTLHFLGDVARHRVAALADSLRVPFRAFELELGVPECWPRGLAVLQPQAVPVELRDLHAALGEVLPAQGLPVDAREFRPHVTLARRASGAIPPARAAELRWRVAAYVLVESVPGAGYRVLREYGAT